MSSSSVQDSAFNAQDCNIHKSKPKCHSPQTFSERNTVTSVLAGYIQALICNTENHPEENVTWICSTPHLAQILTKLNNAEMILAFMSLPFHMFPCQGTLSGEDGDGGALF